MYSRSPDHSLPCNTLFTGVQCSSFSEIKRKSPFDRLCWERRQPMLQMKHLPKTVVIAITILLAVAVSTPVLHTQAANTQRAAIQSTTRTDLAQRDLLSRPLLDSSFTSTRNVEGKSAFLRTR